MGAFDRVKWRMREAFSRSTYTPLQQLQELMTHSPNKNEPIITIVWHLRLGDIVLNSNKEHFVQLALQLATLLQKANNLPVHIFFLGQDNVLGSFPFLPEICKDLFQGNCSYPIMGVKETLYYMVESDVLITSGSSFPAIAALLRTKGLVLYEYPKENVLGIYELSEHGLIDPNGTIVKPSMSELRHQLQVIFRQITVRY